jgi:hypothetical protein
MAPNTRRLRLDSNEKTGLSAQVKGEMDPDMIEAGCRWSLPTPGLIGNTYLEMAIKCHRLVGSKNY